MQDNKSNKMPSPLKEYINRLILTAVLSVAAIIITAIVFRSPGLLLLLLFTAYFAYLIYDIKHKWRKKLIKQIPAICKSVRSDFIANKTILRFESVIIDENTKSSEQPDKKQLKFVLANRRKAKDYSIGQTYTLYVAENAPHYLIGAETYLQ